MSVKRKEDHIALTTKSQVGLDQQDTRFNYEPLLQGHTGHLTPFSFLGKQISLPLWVSSMTGGAGIAKNINSNLAKACHQFGMGMGLGSCRSLLNSDAHLSDFDVRKIIGDDLPLYANLGIGQLEELVADKQLHKIKTMIDKLSVDGLIVHVNPLQELTQPEGDVFKKAPLETISALLDALDIKIIVKEVGQGMGPASLKALLNLPISGIEFGAFGGTNFAQLELLRQEEQSYLAPFVNVGHSTAEMVDTYNDLMTEILPKNHIDIIISGGIKTYLDGYYLLSKINTQAVYGQASAFLKYAKEGYEPLEKHLMQQKHGLEMAQAFLTIKE